MLKFIAQLIFVLLTLSAGVINIFVNISAISTDLVPSALKYITVDTSLLGQSLSSQNAELDVSVSVWQRNKIFTYYYTESLHNKLGRPSQTRVRG